MDTTTSKNKTLDMLIGLFDYHSRLFNNAIEGISDKDANDRLGTKANHVAWLTGSLVYERYFLASIFGINEKQLSFELFKDHKGIRDGITYPTLHEFRNDWQKITPLLREALLNARDEQLNAPAPFQMPGENYTLLEFLPFCIDRESYCIGQIGLYRRLLGYEAMKYN